MFHKRAGPDYEGRDTAAKRLRANIADAFLSNEISGHRTQSMFDDGAEAGLRVMQRLADPKAAAKKHGHTARNLRRKLLKHSKWPGMFEYKIRVWDPKTQAETVTRAPFLLIHEVLLAMSKKNDMNKLCERNGLSEPAKKHMAWVSSELGDPNIIPLGLWGDGVPCNFDKSQTLEMLLWSLPGLQSSMRVPIACINKKFMHTRNTIDDCMKVVAWSLKALAMGQMPEFGPDGEKLSGKRGKSAGQPLPKAALCEVRADWAFYKATFRFPQHNELGGICFRCRCTPAEIRDVASTAAWRANRLTHWQLLERMVLSGESISPLFSAPYIRSDIFAIDWLHCADHGVTKDLLGALFRHCLPKFPGNNNAARCQELFKDIQAYYRSKPSDELPGRLDNLTLSMLGSPSKPPTLRSKAGEARALVPYALQLAVSKLDANNELDKTILVCAQHLNACYENLSPEKFQAEHLKINCRKYCTLLVALESSVNDSSRWHVKPKLHMFQELCETMDSCPSLTWTYRDEDAGGGLMQVGRRRGGSNNCWATGLNVLDKFRAKNRIPVL